jgi:hypothetical protein
MTTNKKQFFSVLISVLICVFVFSVIVYATTTVGENVTIGGTLTIGGVAPLKADGTQALTANWDVGAFKVSVDSLWFNSYNNIVINGHKATTLDPSGGDNIYMGYAAGFGSTTSTNNIGYYNIGLGVAALQRVESGHQNIAIGGNVLENLVSGNGIIAIGHDAGYNNITGSTNIFLGYRAGYYETDSNKLFIDNTGRASEEDARGKALIYGEFDATPSNQILRVNGFLGVGTVATPSYQLSVDGTASISDNLYTEDIFASGVVSASDANGLMIGEGVKLTAGLASPSGACGTAGSLYIRSGQADIDLVINICGSDGAWNPTDQ